MEIYALQVVRQAPWETVGGDVASDQLHPGNIALMRNRLAANSKCLSKVSGGLKSILPLAATPKLGTPTDSDGDGVSNTFEASKGTNPNDRGSFTDQLKSPVYASWNSFLGVINILETINTGSSPLNVTATLFTLEGSQGEQISYSLSAGEQRDLIVNDMQGFSADTYGTLKLEFDGALDGRVFYYQRDETLPGDYNFAFGVAFLDPTLGPSAVGFNTFQPSTNEIDRNLPVNNWLSIVNLSNTFQRFLIAKYDQGGSILGSSSTTIAPFGRHDIEAGHATPGPNHVGLMRIIPIDNNTPYLAFVSRYGVGNEGQNKFAFPLIARSGTGETIHVPLSSRYSAQNWLEVMNSLNESTSVQVDILNSAGLLLSSQVHSLAPFSQVHIDATSILGAGGTGHARIKGNKANSVLAQSMHYFRDPAGGVDALYGSQAREAFASELNGSYNLFLEMGAELTVINTDSSVYNGVVTTQKSDLSTAQSLLTLNATGHYINDLRTDPTFLLSPNTYGVVNISDSSVPVIAEIVRVRISPYHGRVDFAAPTAIR